MNHPISTFILENFPGLTTEIYGLPTWYWVSIALAIIASVLIASFIKAPLSRMLASLFHQIDMADKRLFIQNLRGPIYVLTMIGIFLLLCFFIREPEKENEVLSTAKSVAIFLSLTYLTYGLIDWGFSRLIRKSTGPRSRIGLILPLGRRVAKTLLIILAFLVLLSQFGVDVSAFLVGLGVGGLAIALAAQKILENLFGGAVLSLDQPFKVGDLCKCGDILGYIEEIGVRSTRIRTIERTLVTIPNSKLSEMHIENFMEREKIRLHNIWRIDLSTSLSGIRSVLGDFERILLSDDNFYNDTYRVRLFGVSDLGFEIEVLSYAKATEWSEFVAMREHLFFKFIEAMNEHGVRLALPTNLHYQAPSQLYGPFNVT